MNTPTSPPDPVPAHITVVTSPGCHFCHEAQDVLDELAREFPIEVHEVDLRSPAGVDLVQRHGAGMSPLVLLDGRFVSAGRLPREILRMRLTLRANLAGVSR